MSYVLRLLKGALQLVGSVLRPIDRLLAPLYAAAARRIQRQWHRLDRDRDTRGS